MRNQELNPDRILNDAIAEMRNETPDPTEADRAAARVRQKLAQPAGVAPASVERLRSCADFQALIPAYLAHTLPEARALLVADHTHECVACRKALEAARMPAHQQVLAFPAARRAGWRKVALGLAAVLLLGVAVTQFDALKDLVAPSPALRVAVESVDGLLYRISDYAIAPLAAGAEFAAGDRIRAAKGSRAVVRLANGTRVELNERAELAISDRRNETKIQLARGSIIVRAAKRRAGHLRVSTDDCLVSVTGTTFAVNRGTKGSRVSVVEGEVRVNQGKQEKVLRGGDQLTTNAALGGVPVRDELAWSRDLDVYLALLKEVQATEKALEALARPGLRYSSRLVPLVPENAVLFASFPNLSSTLAEAHRIFRERIEENPVLREWWKQKMETRGEPRVEEIVEKIRAFGDYLGDEVVVAVTSDGRGGWQEPMLMAEVKRPGLRGFIDQQKFDGLRILDGPAIARRQKSDTLMLLRDNLVAISPDAMPLQQLAARLSFPGTGAAAATPLHARINEAYRNGAEWLFAADLQAIISQDARNPRDREAHRRLGLDNIRHLIVERKQVQGQTETRAAVSFGEQRQGITAWIAEPGPMGALQFFSADANMVAAFVVENPALALEDLFRMAEAAEPNFRSKLAEIESQLGVSLQNDIAAALGGEFAAGLDGPALPTPSWKVVVEVYDPGRLQSALERLVDNGSRVASAEGGPTFRLTREQAGGLTYYTITSSAGSESAHYVFVDGYLVAAPSRALLDQAIQYRRSGYTLSASPEFRALLPPDGQLNFSALSYTNMRSVLGPLVEQGRQAGAELTDQQRQAIQALSGGMKPTLVYAYAGRNQIALATNDRGGFGLSNLLGMTGPLGLEQMLGRGAGRGKRRQ
jgi:ferric-dicitrate binding protein FerR (iron transport regulator)